jgi:hypothetical protein
LKERKEWRYLGDTASDIKVSEKPKERKIQPKMENQNITLENRNGKKEERSR